MQTAKYGIRLSRLLLSAIMLLVLSVVGVQARDITLVKDGKSDYSIVLSKDASPSEKHAAEELQKFIREISGTELPIITEGQGTPKRMIVLGDGETLRSLKVSIDSSALGDEGFVIKSAWSHLVIAGGRLRGTMYGVYSFLEESLGCRWYTSFVSRIPKTSTIILKPVDVTQKPAFEYREPYYTDALDGDWAARNRVNGHFAKLDEARGEKMVYGRFCHTFDELVPMDKYFADHPEYYSLVNGKRVGGQYEGQLCLSNPDVLKIVTETLLSWIETTPKATIWSVTQNDNGRYCQCDGCKAVDQEEGSPSGLMLRFVNAVADEVAKKYPGKLIDTFAYQYTEKPPKITKPRPNVRVRLCAIQNCLYHPFEQCQKNAPFMENIKNWREITDTLYIWHYNTNFGNYLLPLPDLDELAADIPMYTRYDVRGIFAQGTYTGGCGPAGGAGWMDELKAYLIAKLLWNPQADAKAVTADFLNGFFGKAGKPMAEYVELVHAKTRKADVHGKFSGGLEQVSFLTPDVITECDRLFDEAEQLADNDEVLGRVKHARLAIRYVNILRRVDSSASSGSAEEKAATLSDLQAFIKDCEADGIIQLSEGGKLESHYEKLAAKL